MSIPLAGPRDRLCEIGCANGDRMLLGIDEGTTGVKAALFDERLKPLTKRGGTRSTATREEGWVEQDGEEVITAVTGSVAELLDGADGEVVACGLDHQGESVLAWDSERASRSARSSSGRTSAPRRSSTSSPTRRTRSRSSAACPSTPISPRPSWPGC